MRSKGLLPSTVFLLILFVVILVFGFVFVKTYADKAQQYLNQLIQETPESLALKDAIRCSHYRCFDGCDKVKEMKWEYLDNLECPCEKADLNKDEKVCDDEARLSPISVITVEPGQLFKRNEVKEFEESSQKVFFIDESLDKCKDRLFPGVITVDKDNILAYVDDDACKAARRTALGCYERVVLEAGPYFVWTTSSTLGVGANTVVCGTEPEVSQIDCATVGGTCFIENCPSGYDIIKGKCPEGRDISRICCRQT